ncbi:hypothetical protein MCOR02_004241 [Pyricularia oryzae]|uniref:CHL4 family chromosome segregation protein n=1 Tax=Pyricularia oryzae TaxID=318829 RepID=A0A4P7MWE3_PYROR|nr:hypothetical protein MCOR02_004241 [Pyricularia oryzae]KAI6285547.1 hypothetical protein MCOR34_010937 [Pyricularia oryzae]KAI6465419.1 hypothetical protein MCOR17_005075 [Pyricularia oryzae]KAI6507097.1 hypothetical protein MCOR13_003045 [Pyricularia oryzae]KAI6580241.1 hypothetical protein MCOR04_005780 [Pyricularia oryzae]
MPPYLTYFTGQASFGYICLTPLGCPAHVESALKMASISVPTTAQLSGSLRLPPAHAVTKKLISRLSRKSLAELALSWLAQSSDASLSPYLSPQDHDDSMYEASQSLEALRDIYSSMLESGNKGSKQEVVDRILEGDWRMGLTLHQLAMADMQHLHDRPHSLRWTAFRTVTLKITDVHGGGDDGELATEVDKESLVVPRFHPTTFLRNLQAELPPDVKTHCAFERHKELAILLLRIFIFDSPYGTNLVAGDLVPPNFDTSRTVYLAFPDASPYVYISNATTVAGSVSNSDAKSLRAMVIESVPNALSRPGERFTLKSTSLSTKNLSELVERRGGGRTNAAGGGWAFYADLRRKESPLDVNLPTPPLSDEDADGGETKRKAGWESEEQKVQKRQRLVALARFGESAKIDDGLGVERVDVVIEDPFPSAADGGSNARPLQGGKSKPDRRQSTLDAALQREAELRDEEEDPSADAGSRWCPRIKLTFHGTHVFAGIRQLVEAGAINGERMPGWMTGEEGVTIGAVKHGRIRGHKGSGV